VTDAEPPDPPHGGEPERGTPRHRAPTCHQLPLISGEQSPCWPPLVVPPRRSLSLLMNNPA